jgi:hypothetical protein
MRGGSFTTAAAVVSVVVWLEGCATSPPPQPVEAKVSEELLAANDIATLLGYTESVRRLTPAELQREYTRVETGYAKKADSAGRVKLAILLSLQHAPFRNEARARGLLLQAIGDSGYNSSPYRQLATLLLIGLDERREWERALEEERRQRQALGKKLDQLKAIEEEIDRRRAPPVMTPRNGSPRPDTNS